MEENKVVWHEKWPVLVFMPWNNLGCLGLKITKHFYVDFFKSPYFGSYCRIGNRRYYFNGRRFWKGYVRSR